MTKQLARRSARRIELRSLNPAHPNYSFDLARGRLDAPHRLGQPVARGRASRQALPPAGFEAPLA